MKITTTDGNVDLYRLPEGYEPLPCSFTVVKDSYFCYPASLFIRRGGVEHDAVENFLVTRTPFGALAGGGGGPANPMETQADRGVVGGDDLPLFIRFVAMPTREELIGRAGMVYNTFWHRRAVPRVGLEPAEAPRP